MNVILRTNDHLGDVVILTNVIHNLKKSFPDINFCVDAREKYLDVFENNPYISWFDKSVADFCIECVYAPYSQKTANAGSCIRAFNINAFEKMRIITGHNRFSIDILTPEFFIKTNDNKYGDYCVINANCQKCSETKAYPYYQDVIDSRPDIKFIQIGGAEERDITSDLRGVIDVRGKTTVKELIELVSHAKWVISPPSAVVHVASAFPNVKTIVLSGAREPVELTKYPNTTHLTSVCPDGWNRNKGCMKFFMRPVDLRTCTRAHMEKGRKYPQCMCEIKKDDICALLK